MKPTLIVLLVFFIALETNIARCATFLNPVLNRDFHDTTVMKSSDGSFYVYATEGNGAHIQVARSKDLVNWEFLGEALPARPGWTNGINYWAPDVTQHGNTYYMYYAASRTQGMCIGVATSSSPAGPFVDKGSPLLCSTDFAAIDPKSFDDPATGKIWLYWGSDFNPIRVQELSPDRMAFASGSSPITTISTSSAPYEGLIEGAWLHFKNGWYYLFYSGNNCCGAQAHYAVLVARAKSPSGPFEKLTNATHRPSSTILELNTRWIAPGHNSVITDSAGQDWIYYHAIDRNLGDYNRRALLMDKITYDPNGWPVIQGSTPSTTPQPGPAV